MSVLSVLSECYLSSSTPFFVLCVSSICLDLCKLQVGQWRVETERTEKRVH